MYCWGNTAYGELGLGGIEDELIVTPRVLEWSENVHVEQASCGRYHSLFLTQDGNVFSCGNNDYGQLGHEKTNKRPHVVAELLNDTIVQISCGNNHSMALTEWGGLYVWGSNDFGQLGIGSGVDLIAPKLSRFFSSKVIVQICCGGNHSMALTSCGELYSWGANVYGQLGVDTSSDMQQSFVPRLVKSLNGIPIAYIACGGNHSFALSKSGAVYGWGRNNCGQLGLNDETDRKYPTQLRTLRTIGVRHIACGDEFSEFLTHDGGVFTCGSGTYGQLGHGGKANESLPRQVMELMGSTVSQIACGSRHSMALVPSRGRVYSFGLGCSGQLGTRTTNNSNVPQVVVGPWVSPNGGALIEAEDADTKSLVVKKIFCGGDHSIVITKHYTDTTQAVVDYRRYDKKTQILEFTHELAVSCASLKADETIDTYFLANVENTFKSLACLNGSMLLEDNKHYGCSSRHHGVDILRVIEAFDVLRNIENQNLKVVIFDKITNELMGSLSANPGDVETLRIYLVLPMYHEFINSKNFERLHTPFSHALDRLTAIPGKILQMWWSEMPLVWFERVVISFREAVAHVITFKIALRSADNERREPIERNEHLDAALKVLSMLHTINHKMRKEKVSHEVFHWTEMLDFVNMQQEYVYWLFDRSMYLDNFNLCNYPFLFNATVKTVLLQTDQSLQMHKAGHDSNILNFFANNMLVPQYILLKVSRANIVQDTLREILRHKPSDLKKQLRIKFINEDGQDGGGVRKEFFMLLMKDVLHPKYGMFSHSDETGALWFAEQSFETAEMFLLIGIICGLVIYNFTIINLPFPVALYKKILGEPVDLSDMCDISPATGRSLQAMLDYEGDDFQTVFNVFFEYSRKIYDTYVSTPLKPNGGETPVTQENKQEFVDLYVDYVLNRSVEAQFDAFKVGFAKVCSGPVLQLFKPDELMAAIVGNEDYDWHQLEDETIYRLGYNSADQTIRWFWEVFHDWPLEDKKKFLVFLTGSDRIPIQGMSAVKISIQPVEDDRYLPVAHTCFNLLDLPRYKSKEVLREKLSHVIDHTRGFSLA